MEGPIVVLAIVAVCLLLLGLFLGQRQGRAGAQSLLDEARNELRDLRPKAEELAAAKAREQAQEEKYIQMKADVDKAFADLASKALRDNNASFLHLAEQKLGAQSNEAKQTLEAKEKAIQALLLPLRSEEHTSELQSLRHLVCR